MECFSVKISGLNQGITEEEALIKQLKNIKSDIEGVKSRVDFQVKGRTGIMNSFNNINAELEGHISVWSSMKGSLGNISEMYQSTEKKNSAISSDQLSVGAEIGILEAVGSAGAQLGSTNAFATFSNEFQSNYGWKEILSGAGYISTIYNLVGDIKKGKTWQDFTGTAVKTYQFLSGAAKTYNNYKKIGNAVGTKTAMTWWVKNITGLKPLGRASTAKNPFTRFANNLTNKTSPFNAQFKNIINNFKGANGVKKAVASWGAVAINGIANWFSNKDEQANSNGTMSDGRVVAETITETVVDTALTYGSSIIAGAAITTVLGSVAAPGIVVVAAGGAIVAGLNAGVKALTGKTTTEWISDTILDTAGAIGNAAKNVGSAVGNAAKSVGNAVGNAAKNVTNAIGNWFGKLSFI